MLIECTGTPENLEELRSAMNNLKPASKIKQGHVSGGGAAFAFDQVWPDEQVTRARWVIEVGQSFDTVTGAVLSATLSAE